MPVSTPDQGFDRHREKAHEASNSAGGCGVTQGHGGWEVAHLWPHLHIGDT